MKKRNLFIIGIAIAIIFAWVSLSKPRSIVKQFYMAGVHIQHLESVRALDGTNYIYSTPKRNAVTIIDVLKRAGYANETKNSYPQTKVFVHEESSILKTEIHRISLTAKVNYLEIVANFPL